jgi:hypothetical protein
MKSFSLSYQSVNIYEEELRIKPAKVSSTASDVVRYVWLQLRRGNRTARRGALNFSTGGNGRRARNFLRLDS